MEIRQGSAGIMVAAARVPVTGLIFVDNAYGFVSVSAPVVSVFTLVLSNPIGPNDCTIHVTVIGVTAGSAAAIQTAPNTITVSTFDAAAAPSDRAFEITVIRHHVGDQ